MKIIQNGLIVNADGVVKADLAIHDSKIYKIATKIDATEEDEVFDASECYVFPGFIDGHTHLEMNNGVCDTADNFASGTAAAVVGGTTTILDFATQEKGQSLQNAITTWDLLTKDKCSCNYRYHMAITDWNDMIKEEILSMPYKGITSFKLYMAYDNLKTKDDEILDCLKTIKKINGVLGVHCENGSLINALTKEQLNLGHTDVKTHAVVRPYSVEAEAINRLCYISKLADHPVHIVHLSSEAGLQEIRNARNEGIQVSVETCPQYLLLQDEVYDLPNFEGAKYVLSPPLRKQQDTIALTKAIMHGEVNTIATDHCSFNFHGQKELGKDNFTLIPSGLPGVEHRIVLMFDYLVLQHNISVETFCALLSTNAAKLYEMYPYKGCLQEGSDGDVVVFDPRKEQTISAKKQVQHVDYTPYEGRLVKGFIKSVFLNGEHVVEGGKLLQPNCGIYVKGSKGCIK